MNEQRIVGKLLKLAKELIAGKADVKDVKKMANSAITTGKTLEKNLMQLVKELEAGNTKKSVDAIKKSINGIEIAINHLSNDLSRLKYLKGELIEIDEQIK